MTTRAAAVLGSFILVAVMVHVGNTIFLPPSPVRSSYSGHIQGDVTYRISPTTTGTHKLDGCKVECFDQFVVVYVDKVKQPTWTDNYVLILPWSQLDGLTLQPPR